MIYTSYFSRIRSLPDEALLVSIAAKPPLWYNGIQMKSLAPPYEILMNYNKDQDVEKYTEEYFRLVLSKLDPSEVVHEISILTMGEHKLYPILLCYEKHDDFCHRHLVASWLNKAGFECEEWERRM